MMVLIVCSSRRVEAALYAMSRGAMITPSYRHSSMMPRFTAKAGAYPAQVSVSVVLVLCAIGEVRIAEPGADGHHGPVLHVLHPRQLAQALRDRIVVHDDHGFVIVDLRQRLAQPLRQIETLRFPVAWQVLAAALDRAVRANHTGTADADERRQVQSDRKSVV